MKYIYDKNIKYQNTLKKLDRFIIWFYTWDSSFLNNFLRDKRNNNNETNKILYFFFYINLFNLEKELLIDFCHNENLILLYNTIFFYENFDKLEDSSLTNIIDNINNNKLDSNQKIYLKNILNIKYSKINNNKLINSFMEYYAIKLNNIILNSPKLEENIIVYKVINLSSTYYDIGSNIFQKTFHSTSCSKYTNFYEYIINRNDTSSFSLLEITCNKGLPVLFTNRKTSYFADHSYEVILPLNVNFNIIEKIDFDLCGYEYYFISALESKKLFKYINKAKEIFDNYCDSKKICNFNTELMKNIINNKPYFKSNDLLQIEKVMKKDPEYHYSHDNLIYERVKCVKIVYDKIIS